METVIYVAVALVAGVVAGKYLLDGTQRACQISLQGGGIIPLGDIYVSVTARETIRWTVAGGSVTSVNISPSGGKNPYQNPTVSGGAGLSGALSSNLAPAEIYSYSLGATGATSNLNGRIIIQR